MRASVTLVLAICLVATCLSWATSQGDHVSQENGELGPETQEVWTLEAVPEEDIIRFYDFNLLRRLKLGTAPLVNPELLGRVERGYRFSIPEDRRLWACAQSEAGRGLIGIPSTSGIIAFEPGDIPCSDANGGIWSLEGADRNVFISPSHEISGAQGSVQRSNDPVITWDSHGLTWE